MLLKDITSLKTALHCEATCYGHARNSVCLSGMQAEVVRCYSTTKPQEFRVDGFMYTVSLTLENTICIMFCWPLVVLRSVFFWRGPDFVYLVHPYKDADAHRLWLTHARRRLLPVVLQYFTDQLGSQQLLNNIYCFYSVPCCMFQAEEALQSFLLLVCGYRITTLPDMHYTNQINHWILVFHKELWSVLFCINFNFNFSLPWNTLAPNNNEKQMRLVCVRVCVLYYM